MPPVKISKSQPANTPVGDVTPEEVASIRAGVGGKELAPSSRIQAGVANWQLAVDQLGAPYETERIPISRLRSMRRDPMLGFGLSFIKTPHIRAKWIINATSSQGPNAQIAAHLDYDLRRIYASTVMQFLNSLDFGFQASAKRFELRTPAGTYIETNPDTGEQEEKPIWSEGNIDPIGWKPFVALRPEGVEPIWNPGGEFDGIEYNPASASMPSGVGQAAQAAGGNNAGTKYEIPLSHSLWFTNEKEANFGSIFGYPRLGYTFRYWWSYWFRWAIADRAFERKADPSVLVYHPEGSFINDQTGEETDYAEYALLMGDRMRSGGVIALPSEVYEDSNGKGTIRQWEIDFTKDAVNFEPFDNSFEYLDIQKLRSLFIPEQAFLEGKGGTSSRNVAAEMGDSFMESQAVLSAMITEHINRYMIPQWLAINYPEFVADQAGRAEMIMQGFSDEDTTFTTAVIQLIGQQETGMEEILKLVDLRRMLQSRGTPLSDMATQKRMETLIEQKAAANAAPATPGIPGQQVGVVPTGTGFTAYINPRERIELSDSGTDFIDNLPNTAHYQDPAIKGLARRLWNVYSDLYASEYEEIISAIENADEPIELANREDLEKILARAKEIISSAPMSKKWPQSLELTSNLISKIMTKASRLELSKAKLKGKVSADNISEWIKDRLASTAPQVAQTTREELQAFLVAELSENDSAAIDRKALAAKAREHFKEFPAWKADRLVRTEVRDAYNEATLQTAEDSGVEQLQAIDGQLPTSDAECKDRDGRIFPLAEARKEDDHPNGTLEWKIIPVALSVQRSSDLDGAEFEPKTNTITLSDSLSRESEARILKTVVESVIENYETTED